MSVHRNDPCPCGSGSKYKKCCMNTEHARSRLARSTADPTEVVTAQMIPYFFLKEWNSARARGDFALLFALCHEDGPYRARFTSPEDFYTRSQTQPVPAGSDWMLERIKLDEKDARLLLSRGARDTRAQLYEVEHLHLRKMADGWRVWDAQSARLTKGEDHEAVVEFSTFEVASLTSTWLELARNGFERPDLADRPEPEATAEGDEGDSSVDDAIADDTAPVSGELTAVDAEATSTAPAEA